MTTYVFDIDGTICSLTEGEYGSARPINERIYLINKLFESGHKIIFLTARGMGTSNNDQEQASEKWRELTERQLQEWGVKFHNLFFGKPAGDFYIDDKAINDVNFFNFHN